MTKPTLPSKYPAFINPNEEITFGEYQEFLWEQPNLLYERGRFPIKKNGNFLTFSPDDILPFNLIGREVPDKCGLVHFFIHYLFRTLYDLVGKEEAIKKFRLVKNYLDFRGNFKNKSIPMLEFYLILGRKGGLFVYFFEDRMGFGEEVFMNRNPYIKQCLLQPHIRISLEHWWIGMYGEEVIEKMKKDHLSKWKKAPKEQIIDDLQEMMEKIGTFKLEGEFQNGSPFCMKGKFTEKNLNKYEEIKDYISDNGDVGYRYYKGEKRVIKGEKRFDYKKDGNQNKKQ